MKSIMILTVLLASVVVVACDNSGSTGSASSSSAAGDCSEAVDRAVRDAGPDDSVIIHARDKALEDCMADNLRVRTWRYKNPLKIRASIDYADYPG